jgi:hypothetical protein
MMIVTTKANVRCTHSAPVKLESKQNLVKIDEGFVLVKPDPVGKPVERCPFIGVGIKPCKFTLAVLTGYSDYITIDGDPVVLDTLKGMTDAVPPVASYSVHGSLTAPSVPDAGQKWVDHK